MSVRARNSKPDCGRIADQSPGKAAPRDPADPPAERSASGRRVPPLPPLARCFASSPRGTSSSRRVWVDGFAPGSPTPSTPAPLHPCTPPSHIPGAVPRGGRPTPRQWTPSRGSRTAGLRQLRRPQPRWGASRTHRPSASTSNLLCQCGTQPRRGLVASAPAVAPRRPLPRANLCECKLCEVSAARAPPQLAPMPHAAARGRERTAVPGHAAPLSLPPLLPRRRARSPRAAVPALSRPGASAQPPAGLPPPGPRRPAPGRGPAPDGEAAARPLALRAPQSRGPPAHSPMARRPAARRLRAHVPGRAASDGRE